MTSLPASDDAAEDVRKRFAQSSQRRSGENCHMTVSCFSRVWGVAAYDMAMMQPITCDQTIM